MNHQGFAIAQVSQVVDQFQVVDKLKTGLLILESECKHSPVPLCVKLRFCGLVRRMIFEPGIVDPGHFRSLAEIMRRLKGIGHMPLHAQRQRIEAEHGHICMQRRLSGTKIDMLLAPNLIQQRQRPLAVDKRLEVRKPLLGPVECAAVDDNAPDHISVTAQVFGCGMDHHIRAGFEWPAKIRCRQGAVHHQRKPVSMSHLSCFRYLGNIHLGIADGFKINKPRLGTDGLLHGLCI